MQDDYGNQIPTLPQMWDRMNEFQKDLKTNTEATSRIESNTSELIQTFNDFKGAFKVLSWIGKLAIPFTAIAALIITVKSGITPK